MNRFTPIKYSAFLLPAFAIGVSTVSADEHKHDAPCDQNQVSVNAEQSPDRQAAEKASMAAARSDVSDKARAAAEAHKEMARADKGVARATAVAAMADARADAEKAKIKSDAAIAEVKADADKAAVKADAAMAEARADADKARVKTDAADSEVRKLNYLANQPANDYFSTDLIGKKITNTRNDKVVGEVNEILIGQDGQIGAVIISTGGLMGLCEKDVAIAWNQINHTTNGEKTTLSVDFSEDSIADAPAFARNEPKSGK